MPTKSKTTTTTPGSKKRSRRQVRIPRTAGKATTDFSQYLVPGAALVGSGLLTTAGVLMRKHLGEILASAGRTVLSQGAAAVAQVDFGALLARIGLQKRHSSFVGPGLGAVAGAVAGAALTLWLAPTLLPLIKHALAPPEIVPFTSPKVVRDDTGRSNTLDHGTS